MLMQQLLNGIVAGSVYALFALGFNMVLGALNILNVAQGAIFAMSAFVAFYAMKLYSVPFVVALLLAVVAGGLVNMLLETIIFRPLRARGGSPMATLVASIGASMVLLSVTQKLSGAQIERFPFNSLPDTQWIVNDVRVTFIQLLVLVTTVCVLIGSYVLLNRTKLGKAIRTMAFNERIARMLGIPTAGAARWTFFISGALGGLAGVLLGVMFNSVHFLMGEPYVLKGFAAIVIGGFGSVPGVVVASMLIGLSEVFSIMIGIGAFRDVVIFGILFCFLILRPNGMFGRDEEPRP